MASAADIGIAALLERLVGADPLATLVVVAAAGRTDVLAEFVIETLGGEIPLLLGNPFLNRKCGSMMNFGTGLPPDRRRHSPASLSQPAGL
jgi:hypothetical protein